MTSGARARLLLWGPVAVYAIVIFVLSSIAHPPELPGSDKQRHALLYCGFGLVLARALAGGLHRPVTLAIALSATLLSGAYGVSDEIHQYFVPPREAEVMDVVADTIGAAIAAAALYAWGIIRSRHALRQPPDRT